MFEPAYGVTRHGHGTAYYVDAVAGRDTNAGTSPGRAWRTLARVDAATYGAGDGILLHGGQTFRGSLTFNRRHTGVAPITVTSYGGGRATIAPGPRNGIQIENRAALHISRLVLTGTDSSCRHETYGILFDASAIGGVLHHIHIDHVDVSGFCYGIVVSTEDNRSKFQDVRITYAAVHDNGSAGVQTFDPATGAHDIHDVYISHVTAYRNADNGGIALFGVDHGLVEHSVAYANGARDHGGVGIWAFDSSHITIQFNVSYGNLSTAEDGDGFDFDGGVTDSVMQYNYSYGNVGIGYLVCGCVPYYQMRNIVVRYNISVNDGATGQPSGFFLDGGEPLSGVEVYNNTFISSSGTGPLVDILGGGHPYVGVHLRNNIFFAGPGTQLVNVEDPRYARDLRFQGNDYFALGARLDLRWGRRLFRTLESWRRGTGSETLGRRPVGLAVDPGLCGQSPGSPPPSPSGFRLRVGSPLIDRGLNLIATFGVFPGRRDLFGDPLPARGPVDVGAAESRPGRSCR